MEVTQEDRNAGWYYAGFHCQPDSQMRERWFSGYYDDIDAGHAIRAFARHRTTALAAKEAENAELRANVEKLREELRVGDKVRVIGKYEADWQGYDLWITGINADHEGLNYTVGEQWPVPHRHMGGYIGMTDGFRESDLARTTLAETQP